MGMLISNFSSGGILGSYIDCISVFSTENYKAFLSMLRDSSSPEKNTSVHASNTYCQPLKSCSTIGIPICTLYNSELPFNFTCFTVSKLYLYQQVSLYSWNRCHPRPCPHWGQKSQVHATLNKGTHLTAISTRSNLSTLMTSTSLFPGWTGPKSRFPSHFSKKKKETNKKISHTHTHKLRCWPLD